MPYKEKNDQDIGDIYTGTRVCKICDKRKEMTEFHFSNEKRHRRRQCKTCNDETRAKRWGADPQKYAKLARWNYIRREYGLSEGDFWRILESQNGACAICLERKEELKQWHIDHDHSTGRVRGILCFTCNTALGKFHDDEEILESAIRYLHRSKGGF